MNLPAVLCDVCPEPGVCCKKMTITLHKDKVSGLLSFWLEEGSRLAALVVLARNDFPFLPIEEPEYGEADGKKYVSYYASCPELLPHGRCGIYEHRPQLCRDYAPASSVLCVYGRESK